MKFLATPLLRSTEKSRARLHVIWPKAGVYRAVFAIRDASKKRSVGSIDEFTVCGVENGGVLVAGRRRAVRHEHDGHERSVTTTVLEADLASVRLHATRQHRVPLATLEDHVRQELLHTHTHTHARRLPFIPPEGETS